MSIFNIEGKEISQLSDVDLRELIGKLCEAELRSLGQPTIGVTWSGDQDAPDGGLDVTIDCDSIEIGQSNIPRQYTCFQVKKPKMSERAIIQEMKPYGELRESIKNIIFRRGAYIIISSNSSLTYLNLTKKRQAMTSAVSDIPDNNFFHIDFYDRERIATWVRSHPTLVLWVKEKLNLVLHGWRSYGNWSNTPKGVSDTYFLDDSIKIFCSNDKFNIAKSGLDAIDYIRTKLNETQSFIRLVGLSGVGKTRFVQAIFDSKVGEKYINPDRAIYSDISDSPQPDPIKLANLLSKDESQTILIVDNCPPDLHRRLVETCSSEGIKLSIITIEYDVREDLPEETDVIRLEPSSLELICKIIKLRFPNINTVNCRTISEFAGGNARVAIALASTIKQGEILNRLTDEILFRRLFEQKNTPSDELLRVSEIISLTYSFDYTFSKEENNELNELANIAQLSKEIVHRCVSELSDRNLIQSRGKWRALLPHAIANKLAAQALKKIPHKNILYTMMKNENLRLFKSFTRRLSYLHDSNEAKEIVRTWLATEGWFEKQIAYSKVDNFDILKNLAPVEPRVALLFLERTWANKGDNKINLFFLRHEECTRILRQIAFESDLFNRCVDLICQITLSIDSKNERNPTKQTLESLFYLYLSGTHAPAKLRANVIVKLWNQGDSNSRNLSIELLKASLESNHFSSVQDFSFGGRLRDFGWEPKCQADINDWYHEFISISLILEKSNSSFTKEIRDLLASKFYGLWINMQIFEELENMSYELIKSSPWIEGWVVVCRLLNDETTNTNPGKIEKLKILQDKLQPDNLQDLIRTYTLLSNTLDNDLVLAIEGDFGKAHQKFESIVKSLGQKAVHEIDFSSEIFQELAKCGKSQVFHFGMGMADEYLDKRQLWEKILNLYNTISLDALDVQLLSGVLSSQSFNNIRDEILEKLVYDSHLGAFFPTIQVRFDISPAAVKRLFLSLEFGKASITQFKFIGYGRCSESFSEYELVLFLQSILSKEGGIEVGFQIIVARLLYSGISPQATLIEFARNFLLNFPYDKMDEIKISSLDYQFSKLAEKSIYGSKIKDIVKTICKSLANYFYKNPFYTTSCQLYLGALSKLHSESFLDVFATKQISSNQNLFYGISRLFNPFEKIPDSELIMWCEKNPDLRYPAIIALINPFQINNKKAFELIPIIFHILNLAPNLDEILQVLKNQIIPSSWSGLRSEIILKRVEAFRILFDHPNLHVAKWSKDTFDEILIEAGKEQLNEEYHQQLTNERFE